MRANAGERREGGQKGEEDVCQDEGDEEEESRKVEFFSWHKRKKEKD